MKKFMLIIAMLFSVAILSAQTITEGFEGTFPPEGWAVSGSWTQDNENFSGSYSAYVPDAGNTDSRLTLPIYNIQQGTVLSFKLYCEYASYADQTAFTIEVSPSLGADSVWQVVQTINYPAQSYIWEDRIIEFAEYAGQELYVSLHVVNANGAGTFVDDLELKTITCPVVENLNVHSITTTTAELVFSDIMYSGNYTIEVEQLNPTSADSIQIFMANDTAFSITGLEASSAYKVRVKSICGENDESEWSDYVTFTTACTDLITELPWEFDFEGLSFLTCWTPLQTAMYDGVQYPTLYTSSYYGNYMLFKYGNGMAIAPLVSGDINTLRIQFEAERSMYGYGTLMVGLISDESNIESFIPVDTIALQDDVRLFIVDFDEVVLTENADYRIAFKYICNNDNSATASIDNIVISTIPTCPSPEKQSVTVSANATNAFVSWTDLDQDHEAWIVYYKSASETEWNTQNATEQSALIEGLDPQTSYSLYVMTDCGTEDNTDKTLTVQFTTPHLSAPMPFFEDFDTDDEISDIHFIHETGNNRWIVGDSTGYSQTTQNTEGRSLYISNDSASYSYQNNSTTYSFAYVQVELSNPELEYNLSFDYKVPGGENGFDYLSVYLIDANQTVNSDLYYNSSTPTLLYRKAYVSDWTNFSYTFPHEMIGTTKKIVFMWKNDSAGGSNSPAAVDNIHIFGTDCITPHTITTTEITSTSATLNWFGSADEYIIKYQIANDTVVNTITVSDTTYTLTDLEPASTYSFTLQSSCGEESSSITEAQTFSTLCGPIEDVVWFENFESALSNQTVANEIMRCWSVLQTASFWNGTFPRIYHEGYAQAAHSGSVTIEFKGAENLLVLPEFATDVNTLQFSFYANTTAANAASAGFMEIGIMTDVDDLNSFIVLDTVEPVGFQRSGSYPVSFDFNSLEQTEGRIAMRYTNMTNPGESWNLDDFQVQQIPSCPSPEKESVSVSDLNSTQVTISWTDNDPQHNAWLVYYKHSSESLYTEVAATQQSITLTNLIPASQYSVYVKTDCGTEDNFDQTNIVNFNTIAVPVSEFPYYQDFEDLINNPALIELYSENTNKWAIGNAIGVVSEDNDDETHTSLYVSNNNGTNYAYSTNVSSHSYAVMPIQFGESAEYTLEFDYQVSGEVSSMIYDYLKVVLCDVDYTIPTSGAPEGTILLDNTAGINSWTHFSTALTGVSSQIKKVVFYWYNDGTSGTGIPAAIDNISITASNCATPTNFTCTNTDPAETTLTWEENSSSSSWTIYYKKAEDTTYTSIEVTTNPYIFNEFEPSTVYMLYIVTNCGEEQSSPSDVISFYTDCQSIVTTFPFFEGFESNELSCWQIQNITGANNWYNTTSVNGDGTIYPSQDERMMFYPYNAMNSGRLITPMFDLSELTTPYLKFDYYLGSYNGFSETLTVQYRTEDDTTWTDLVSYNNGTNQWVTDSIYLNNLSQTYQISFVAVGNNGWGVGLDAVKVYDSEGEIEEPEPDTEPCDAPTNLSASNITETTAEITWTGTATTYEFKLNGGEAETLTATTKSLTDLTPNTTYMVEVRAICEEENSAWVSTTFTTLEEVAIQDGEVITQLATNITNTSATLNGALVSAGNSENYTVGFALSTVSEFTLEDSGVQNITATLTDNTFAATVNDLTGGQTYFYRAYITNEAGTAYGALETFTLLGLTDALANQIAVQLYPNPASDNATLDINGLNQDAKIVISDLQGRILSQDNINAGTTRYTINVSQMTSGVYYIRIITDNVESTQKLIVE
jgi:hypothetical protein